MNTYKKEIIYACCMSVGLISCAVCILSGYYNLALFTLLCASVFILLEMYSLFLKIDGSITGCVSNATASLKPDAYSMPDEFSFQDGIDAVSEPVIIHKKEDSK